MTISSDDGAPRKQVMPAMTQALGNKVAASRNVSDEIPINRPEPPPNSGITTAVPIGSRRMSGNQTRDWPANKGGGGFMYYGGKGSR
jgi:hypothetical protein